MDNNNSRGEKKNSDRLATRRQGPKSPRIDPSLAGNYKADRYQDLTGCLTGLITEDSITSFTFRY